jgi:hypothetical protein
MSKRPSKFHSNGFGSAALYQPSRKEVSRTVGLVLLLLIVLLIGIATRANAGENGCQSPGVQGEHQTVQQLSRH